MERSEETTQLVTWQVIIRPPALKLLEQISDKRIRRLIEKTFIGLRHEPDKQGYALRDELTGYRAKRVAGQRYRVIYGCDAKRHVVSVVGVGIRKEGSHRDIYYQAARILGR